MSIITPSFGDGKRALITGGDQRPFSIKPEMA